MPCWCHSRVKSDNLNLDLLPDVQYLPQQDLQARFWSAVSEQR